MPTVKNVNAIAVTIDKETVAKLDLKPINQEITDIKKEIGLEDGGSGSGTTTIAFTDKNNVFTVKQKLNQGLEFDKVDHNNIFMTTTEAANTSVATPTGLNMTLMSSDNKKFGSVILGVSGTNREAKLVVNKNDGSLAGSLSVTSDGTNIKAHAPIINDLKTAEDSEIITKKALEKAFEDASNPDEGEPSLIPQATETNSGIIELATQEEVNTGTDDKRAVTPKSLKAVTNALQQEIQDSQRGKSQLGYKDYSQTGNRDDMKVGIYYKLPFNKADKFITFDETGPNAGKPSTTQNGDLDGDVKVAKYKIYFKGQDGTVNYLGDEDPTLTFEDMASKSKDNTFTGSNTFNKKITATGGISSDHTVNVSAGGNDLPNATQVKTYVDSFKPQLVTAMPDAGSMESGVIYFEHEA